MTNAAYSLEATPEIPQVSRSKIEVLSTDISGVNIIHYPVPEDERGTFAELFAPERLEAANLPPFPFAQMNVTTNRRGTTRGIHSEGWHKYASPILGRFDITVLDMRPKEPTFGKFLHVEAAPGTAILIPPGCGHGYQANDDASVYAYTSSELWTPGALQDWVDPFDPKLQIPWKVPAPEAVMLERERNAPSFQTWAARVGATAIHSVT